MVRTELDRLGAVEDDEFILQPWRKHGTRERHPGVMLEENGRAPSVAVGVSRAAMRVGQVRLL
jgi:hypothetical protein